jgi:D-alanyl-lipoteichoic acid acyltransferase DltB (MBOAT superfamily)
MYALLIFAITVVTYGLARCMEAFPERKKISLTLGLIGIFGILIFFKYFNFLSLSLTDIFQVWHWPIQLPTFHYLLPIGISFYSFQVGGYLMDVFRGKSKAEQNFGVYALFVAFFPIVTSGPIERAGHLIPQLLAKHHFDYARTISGLQLFVFGLFKKLVIADNLAIVVDRVFNGLPNFKGLSLLIAVGLFSWQIYADFSGYTDMARGIARILGFDILENFKCPYLATSVRDFWRRWHISLSSWFRDYLYIPLGGSRHGLARACLNTLIVFVLCGLWHGAAWTFAWWGLLHGVILAVERVATTILPKQIPVPKLVAILYTNLLLGITWVFFRSSNLNDAIYVMRNSVVGVRNFISPSYIWATISQLFKTNVMEMAVVGFCLITIVSLELVTSRYPLGRIIRRQHFVVRWLTYSLVMASILLLRQSAITKFIYVQF